MSIIIATDKGTMNIGVGLIAGILMTIGIYFLIWGIGTQWNTGVVWNWWALLYYFIAVVLLGIGKHLCITYAS